MAPKRGKEVASSPARQAKKAKRDADGKVNTQLREVTAALSQAEVTKQVAKMLEAVLPLSLGECSDQRHSYQEQVVTGLAEVLAEVEAASRKAAADKRAARDAAVTEKPIREKEVADSASTLTAKIAEVHRLKVALAEKAVSFRAARTALAEAEEAKAVDGLKSKEAEKKKADFQVAHEKLTTLKTAAPEEAETKKTRNDLMSSLKKYHFEESMLIALPAALAKAPDARGQFDMMSITQLEGELDKLIAEQDAILAAAAPGQAKCDAAIKEAQDALAAARGAQRAAAKAFDVASKEQVECETISAAAQKALRQNAQLSKKLDTAVNNAEVEVELFEQGPRESFKELRERITPAPAAEVPADEEMADEPAKEANEADVPMAAA